MFNSARKYTRLLGSVVKRSNNSPYGSVGMLSPVRKGCYIQLPSFNDGQYLWRACPAVALAGVFIARNHYGQVRVFVSARKAVRFVFTV